MKPLKYPFTYEQWLRHQSTKPKLKWCKEVAQKIKHGKQQQLEL